MECKYKQVDRTGLYIFVFLIFLNVVCFNKKTEIKDTNQKCTEILERLDKIEAKIDSLTSVQNDSLGLYQPPPY